MRFITPRRTGGSLLLAVAAAAFAAGPALADSGALYTQTNNPSGNVVQAFARTADGRLSQPRSYPTGGQGSASLGGRQGAVELSDDGKHVYAVNAGSNTVTAFAVTKSGLRLAATVPSGGSAPASIDEHGGRIYVLNSGGTTNVAAFDSALEPIGTRELPGAAGAAQVSVAPDGSALVVSERLSSRLETLALDAEGRPGEPVVTPSAGAVPFGFAFGLRGELVVSEAGTSTVSSYRLGSGLEPVTVAAPVGQGAPCWVAITPNGRFAYTGNGSGSISGYAIAPGGVLSALAADGRTAVPPQSPRDLDLARNGRYLYAVSPGNATDGGSVTGYRVAADGSLDEITRVRAATGLTGAAAA